jgi:hypothetical protein
VVELTQAALWHRQVAALAAAADRAGVADEHLPSIRTRLLGQQGRFTEAAGRARAPLPVLVPTPTEISASAPALGDLSRPAVSASVLASYSTLDAVDAVLDGYLGVAPPAPVPAGPPTGPVLTTAAPTGVAGWSPGPRNALVYGGYSLAVLVIQLVLLAVANEQVQLPLLAPLCLLVLPAFAWAAGWFTVGIAFRPLPGTRSVRRTPRLGAVIAMLPNLLLCAGLGVLFAVDRMHR